MANGKWTTEAARDLGNLWRRIEMENGFYRVGTEKWKTGSQDRER